MAQQLNGLAILIDHPVRTEGLEVVVDFPHLLHLSSTPTLTTLKAVVLLVLVVLGLALALTFTRAVHASPVTARLR